MSRSVLKQVNRPLAASRPAQRHDATRHAGAIVVVTGLAFEAQIAGGATIVGEDLRQGTQLSSALACGPRGVISFGIGGGLADDLAPGQWVVAASVVSGSERHRTDDSWSQSILRALPGARHATVAGVDRPVSDPEAKRTLQRRTGAVIVDTESHVVARLAAAHDVPFVVCRVVVDPVHRWLPPAALLDLLPGGIPNVAAILRSLAAQPGQLPMLARLAVDAAIARAALRRARTRLGADLGFPHFSDRSADLVDPHAEPVDGTGFRRAEISPA
jgi:hopanoid-associated phosphorylase